MSTTFRKIPVEVEAVRWTGANFAELHEFTGHTNLPDGHPTDAFRAAPHREADLGENAAEVWDYLHLTWVGVRVGQWIIRGTEGEYYPCDGDGVAPINYEHAATAELLEDEDGAPYPPEVQEARMFFLWRETDVTEVTVPAGGEPRCVAVGVEFSDGQCALWWVPPPPRPVRGPRRGADQGPRASVAVWPARRHLEDVHLHPRSSTKLIDVERP